MSLFTKLSVSDKELKKALSNILGYPPRKIEVYKKALTHRSSLTEDSNEDVDCNERLEYLGDAIIDSVVATRLYLDYPDEDEGFLTKAKAKIVNRSNLNRVAIDLGLDKLIFAQKDILDRRTSIYGNAYEALVGAVYLDKGYVAAERFVTPIITEQTDKDENISHLGNYKSKLIEWSQKNKVSVKFVTLKEFGPEHERKYVIEVRINNEQKGTGEGFSKKAAQQIAAKQAFGLIDEGPIYSEEKE